MAIMEVDELVWRQAAQVTVSMLVLLICALSYQGLWKVAAVRKAVQAKEKLNRYTDPRFVVVDRMVANLGEWLPAFLGLFWISMIASGGGTVVWGWVHVASRALYTVVALNGGLHARAGPQPLILATTVPAYLALVVMVATSVMHLVP